MKHKQNVSSIALNSIMELLTATPAQILAAAHGQLTLLGYEVRTGSDYLFAIPPNAIQESRSVQASNADALTVSANLAGKTPAFVAHVDVVGTVPPKLHEISVSNNKNVLSFTPESANVSINESASTSKKAPPAIRGAQVLGADDRAGVYAMFSVLSTLASSMQGDASSLPYIILTDQEEVGGVGAKEVCNSGLFADHADRISFFLEFDRRGAGEFVSYDSAGAPNEDLESLFMEYGFELGHGSYSDVADFTRKTGISNVNVSVGYHNEHFSEETLHMDELAMTITRITSMLNDEPLVYARQFEENVQSGKGWSRGIYPSFGYNGLDDWNLACATEQEEEDYIHLQLDLESFIKQLDGVSIAAEFINTNVDLFLDSLEDSAMIALEENLEWIHEDYTQLPQSIEAEFVEALVVEVQRRAGSEIIDYDDDLSVEDDDEEEEEDGFLGSLFDKHAI